VLEIWSTISGRKIVWFFPRREASPPGDHPRVETDNAWSGEGFLEFGYLLPGARRRRRPRPEWLCENFDVVAHEAGHLILKSVIGNPTAAKKTLEYRAHEEGAADLVALVACLHFDGVVERLLANTQGRLFSRNMLSRFGEKGRDSQIRKRVQFGHDLVTLDREGRVEVTTSTPFSKLYTGGAFDVSWRSTEHYLVGAGAIPHAWPEIPERQRDRHRRGLALGDPSPVRAASGRASRRISPGTRRSSAGRCSTRATTLGACSPGRGCGRPPRTFPAGTFRAATIASRIRASSPT